MSSRTKGLTMINKRVMPYWINMLDGNVACMMGAESGGSGYYAAVNPQLQVDLLNTTTMTFSAGADPPPPPPPPPPMSLCLQTTTLHPCSCSLYMCRSRGAAGC